MTLRFPISLMVVCVTTLATFSAHAEPWHSANRMTEAANAFVATLDAGQRERAMFSLGADERTVWSNLPTPMAPTPGLMVAEMNDTQRRAVHDLLRASLSSQGYSKFTSVMRLEEILREIEAPAREKLGEDEDDAVRRHILESRRYGNYSVALFGDPASGNWGWKIAGHHAAMNFTVAEGQVGFTPTFLGSSPMVVESGEYAGLSALPHEGERGIELMRSLSAEQKQVAIISTEVADGVFEGPGRRASLSGFEGLKTGGLNEIQQRLLRALVNEYVGNADFDSAEAQLALIEAAGWDELWFSWRGPVDPAGKFYYRVHGPRILIEYNRQDENHDHMIVRDPKNDYGEDWLGKHYQEYHPTREEVRENARRSAGVSSGSR